MKNLQELPKVEDSISFLYIEHAVIEQDNASIVAIRKDGRIPIPVASTLSLLLGPGTKVTHSAIKTMNDNGCMVIWCGEKASRFYASGMGETRSARNLLLQAECCMNPEKHLEVAKRMYLLRFTDFPTKDMTLQQLRGMEGIRVRKAYELASKSTGVTWSKRSYKTTEWADSDDINRALSEANALLYGICHAAIVSMGYSPGLGFIHTGKLLSFVYDIADIYKTETTIPAAFEAVAKEQSNYGTVIRETCRKYFASYKLLNRLPNDINSLFQGIEENISNQAIGDLWTEDGTTIAGGKNYGDSDE